MTPGAGIVLDPQNVQASVNNIDVSGKSGGIIQAVSFGDFAPSGVDLLAIGGAGTLPTDLSGNGYETTVTKPDGSKVEVHLDSSFTVFQGPGGPGRPGGARGAPGNGAAGAPPMGYGG